MNTADTSQFFFKVQSLPDLFQVVKFEGRERLSECFKFSITVVSHEKSFEYSELVGKPASLVFSTESGETSHHGVIVSFEQIPGKSGQSAWVLTLVPSIYLLEYSRNNRVFQQKSIIEIVETVLAESGIPDSAYRFELQNSYSQKEYTVQYNETNLNFIQRLLESSGVFYAFDHSGSTDVMVICDTSTGREYLTDTPALTYQSKDGMTKSETYTIHDFRKKNSMITGKVSFQDYNYNRPSSKISGQTQGSGVGEAYLFSGNLKTAGEAGDLSLQRNELNINARTLLTGSSDCKSLVPGVKILVNDGTGSFLSGECFLTELVHQGDQEAAIFGSGEEPFYTNSFEAIPAEIIYRPPLKALKPEVPGVMSVKVDGQQGDYAFLDDEGRYRVKMPFDRSSSNGGSASLPVRMSQPYAGNDYGMHFPLHTGSEVMVGFENGDLDRPIALGAAPNPASVSPVTSRNKSQSIIRTDSGNELIMEDLESETFVSLKTSGDHRVSLTDIQDDQAIHLQSSGKNEIKINDTDENITLKTRNGTKSISLDHKNKNLTLKTKYGHEIVMDDKDESISLKTAKEHLISIDDKKEHITVSDGKGKNLIQIDIKKNKIILNSEGDMVLKAKKNFNVQAANINLMSKKGSVNVNGKKGVNIKTSKLTANGQQNVSVKSNMDIKLDAGKDLKLTSKMNTESKAGVAHQTSGIMVKAEAKGIQTIKGAMVMIN